MTDVEDGGPPTDVPEVRPGTLREPANTVSPRAIGYWRATTLTGYVVLWLLGAVGFFFLPERPWWAYALFGLVVAATLIHALAMPTVRFRVHRWEVTPTAVFTRSGWISRSQRIAPLNRVQTVDSHQGAVMRLFRLSSITVTTASAAGPVSIDCLDEDIARRVVSELTEITGASEGDAT